MGLSRLSLRCLWLSYVRANWTYRGSQLIGHSIDVLFVRRMEQYVQFPLSTCRLWLAYQGVVVEIFLAIVEGLLMLRGIFCSLYREVLYVTHLTVYALWGRSKRILALLALFLVLEVSCSVVTTSVIVGDAYFNQLCLFKKPPLIFVLFR